MISCPKDTTMKNKRNLIGLLTISVLAIGILLTIGCRNQGPLKPTPTGFLHVQGKRVLDENGNQVFLRGFTGSLHFSSFKENPGVYSLERVYRFNSKLLKHFFSGDDLQDINGMGANVIRQQVSFYDLEIEPYKYNEDMLKVIDELIERSYKNNVYIIFCLTNAAQNSKQPGNIKYYNSKKYLWTDNEFRQRVISAWAHIAEHFADNSGIAGYEIINEPSPPNKEAFHSFYSDIIKTIREVDKKHIIILERNHFFSVKDKEKRNILFGGEYEDDNIMLSLHFYGESEDAKKEKRSDVEYSSRKEIEDGVNEFLSQNEIKNHPICVSEFGAVTFSGENGLRWTKDFMDVMNQHGIHYTYQVYKNRFKTGRGLYQPKESLFLGLGKIPVEEVIDYIEKRMDKELSPKNFETFPGLRQVLEEGFKNKGDDLVLYPQKFHVEGNKIVDESGKEIVFRGLSPGSIHTLAYHTAMGWDINIPWDERLFKEMHKWRAEIIRLPVRPENWRKYSDNEKDRLWRIEVIDQAIEWAANYEMYVYIDFHAVGYLTEEGSKENEISKNEFITFWDEISNYYKDNKVVAFYEIFNEPCHPGAPNSTTEDWLLWKKFAEEVIDVIRKNDPDAVIIVGGLHWAYDISHAIDYPIERENIVYATHPYPKAYEFKTWDEAFGNIKKKYPVFATEFGFYPTGNQPEDSYMGEGRYRDAIKSYLEDKNISWTAWCFRYKGHTKLLEDKNYIPTETGEFFREWLLEYE